MIDGTLHHVKDLCPILKTTPSVIDGECRSLKSELLIQPASCETSGSPENPVTDHSKSTEEGRNLDNPPSEEHLKQKTASALLFV